jgi:lysophospholipase L1-like esterase
MTVAVILLVGCDPGTQEAEGTESTTTTADPVLDVGAWGRIDGGWSGDGPRVAVLGDSIAHQTRGELTDLLDGYAVRIAAVVGEGWLEGDWSRVYGYDLIEDAAIDIAAEGADVVVWVLGTNDVGKLGTPVAEIASEVAEMDDRYSGACVVAVEVNELADVDDETAARSGRLNDVLGVHADVTVTPDPATLAPDGIHPTPEGRRPWAQRVADAVESC